MSWMEELIRVYDANQKLAGNYNAAGQRAVLAPIGHMNNSAQIEITLDLNGTMLFAAIVPKEDKETLIPCTVKSASRAGKAVAPHPLHDNLKYTAKDYEKYSGETFKENDHPYVKYIEQLGRWCGSPYSHPSVNAVYNYVKNNNVIGDLIKQGILFEENGEILQKWNGDVKEKPQIFIIAGGEVLQSFVRFRVDNGSKDSALWKDMDVQQSYIDFYTAEEEADSKKELCYATGEEGIPVALHSRALRNDSDKAKLISSNDKSGFTFRGRFVNATECLNVSYLASQKAMNALKWLSRNQGVEYFEKVILAWGIGKNLPPIMEDSVGFVRKREPTESLHANTMEDFARRFSLAVAGYKADIDNNDRIIVMALDAATQGRLSICYYQEFGGGEFVDRIVKWHERGKWLHHYVDEEKIRYLYWGIVTPNEIVEACYGENVSDNKTKAAIDRIFSCIIEGKIIPRDFMTTIVKRVANQSIKAVQKEYWAWERLLLIACSIIKNYYSDKGLKGEEYTVALDKTVNDRSYLYGRLLATADKIERDTFDKQTDRLTNAMRYMNIFSERPNQTWITIFNKLQPYIAKKGKLGRDKVNLLDEIVDKFSEADFVSNKPLDGRFLLGYHSQRYAFQKEIEERMAAKAALLNEQISVDEVEEGEE